MTISNAIERDGFVVIFNETGNQCASIQIGREPTDGLTGYTSTTVNVRDGNFSQTFDERGNMIGSQQIDDLSSRGNSSENNSRKGGCGTIVLLLLAVVVYGGWESITGADSATGTASEAPAIEQIQDAPSALPEPPIAEAQEFEVLDSDAASNATDQAAQLDPPTENTDSQKQDYPPAPPPPLPPEEPLPANKLASYAVRVRNASGNVEQMQISAKSEEDAYRILRDYRGNPDVVGIEQIR